MIEKTNQSKHIFLKKKLKKNKAQGSFDGMNYDTIRYKQKGKTGYLTLSRPKALNALNSQVFKELEHCLSELENSSLRTLIVQGEGEKAFVAGADIKEMSSMKPEEAEAFSKKGQDVFALFESLPLPVIAVVQGFALGGGLELALACDMILLGEESTLGFPEVKLGLFPSFAGSWRLTHAVGPYRAKEMIFTGDFYSGKQAFAMGLGQALLPKDQLLEKAESYGETFSKRGAVAIAEAKKRIQKSREQDLKSYLKEESQGFGKLFDSEESQEGMQAFLEKREARF